MNPDLFRMAAKVIRIHGHHKGGFTNPRGEVCAVGALSTAATGTPTPAEIIDAEMKTAIEFLSDRVPSNIIDDDPIERIADWNDREGTTPADVIAQLEAAANDIETALAAVDTVAHRVFGRDETRWTAGQRDSYISAIGTARSDKAAA